MALSLSPTDVLSLLHILRGPQSGGCWKANATQPLGCAMGKLWAQLHSQGTGERALAFWAVCIVSIKAKADEGPLHERASECDSGLLSRGRTGCSSWQECINLSV